jgi:glycerol-3-phosphate dehydrogenase (NAD(P)+)
VPLLARAIQRDGLKAPIISALARLIDGSLPLEQWVELVRITRPQPLEKNGRFRRWWRRFTARWRRR